MTKLPASIAHLYPDIIEALLDDEETIARLKLRLGLVEDAPLHPAQAVRPSVQLLNLNKLLRGYLGFSVRTSNMINGDIDTIDQFDALDEPGLAKIHNIGAISLREIQGKRQLITHRALLFVNESDYERAIALMRSMHLIMSVDYREMIAEKVIRIRRNVFDRVVDVFNSHRLYCTEVIRKD